MSLWDTVTRKLAVEPAKHQPLRTRESMSLADFLGRYNPRNEIWRPATVRSALSVPAVVGIVTTIANTIGTLSLEAWRNGVKLAPDDRPQLVKRPDPDRRPGSFWRDSAWSLATYGEAWWWVAKRDLDGQPLSLVVVPPNEIIVEENRADTRHPIIRWRDREMAREDMRQITYIRDLGDLRGKGPLQMCGAAVSVSVEAQEWAANFYAEGGKGGTVIKSAIELGVMDEGWSPEAYLHEADQLRAAWVGRAHNTVRVIDPRIDSVTEHEPNEAGAQMLTARDFQVGEIARMFMFPQSLIGYAVPGSSLTYQNVGQELDKLSRTCLIPNYLEKFEQEMSDLLPRTTTCEFNVDRLLRADLKTRYDVYGIAVDKGILSVDEIRDLEGYGAGDVETSPVPFSPPQALPGPIALRESDDGPVRCATCRKARFNIESTNPLRLRCVNCKDVTEAPLEREETRPLVISPVINVNVPEQPAPVVNVSTPQQPLRVRRLVHDEAGKLTKLIDEPAEGVA